MKRGKRDGVVGRVMLGVTIHAYVLQQAMDDSTSILNLKKKRKEVRTFGALQAFLSNHTADASGPGSQSAVMRCP